MDSFQYWLKKQTGQSIDDSESEKLYFAETSDLRFPSDFERSDKLIFGVSKNHNKGNENTKLFRS